MRKLVVALVAVFVVGLIADIGLKALAEAQIESTATRESEGASADAAIPVFPFLPPLLLSGQVDEVSLRLVDVPAGPATFDRLDFDLQGVEISRRALLRDRRVELVAIDRGSVSAVVQLPAVARAVPLNGLTARVSGRSIVLRGPRGIAVSIPLPADRYLPCQGEAQVESGAVRVTCTLEEIPPALVEAINQGGAG